MPALNNTNTTECPECGNQMGMVAWTGKKPVCHRCAETTYLGHGPGSWKEENTTADELFDTKQ